jgi:hypothetical protein
MESMAEGFPVWRHGNVAEIYAFLLMVEVGHEAMPFRQDNQRRSITAGT